MTLPSTEQPETVALLYQRHGSALRQYFKRRLSAGADFEDLVQEVFVRLLRRGDTSDIEKLDAYLFETASSVLMDYGRQSQSRQVRHHITFDQNLHGDVDFSVEHVLGERELLANVGAALLELPERTRMIFVMRRIDGMRHGDIALRLGISVSAVEKHVARAMAHLITVMDKLQ